MLHSTGLVVLSVASALVGVALTEESCDSTTGDSLLQARKANSILQMMPSSKNPKVVDLVAQTSEVLKSEVTPEVKDTIDKLIKIIDDSIVKKIQGDHNASQKEVDDKIKAIQDSTTTAVEDHASAKAADDAWLGCVGEEKTLVEESEAANADLNTKKEDMESKCGVFDGVKTWSTTVPESLATLTCDFTQGNCATEYDNFKSKLGEWINGLSATIDVKKSEFDEAKTPCDESTRTNNDQSSLATKGETTWKDKTVECKKLETAREVSMCEFGGKLQAKCKANADYDKLLADIDAASGPESETERENEWASMQLLKCMLNKHRADAEFDAETMQACSGENTYVTEVGTLDKKSAVVEGLMTAEKFTCLEETITFSGTTCTLPAGTTATSSEYTCGIAYAPAFNKDISSDSFSFCAVEEKLSLTEILMKLPKTDLHMHIEGSLEPDMAFRLATKYNMLPLQVPKATSGFTEVSTLEQLREVYKFEDLLSFLNIYNLLATTMKEAEDFEGLAYDYVKHAAAQGTLYNEVFFDPQTHTARGLNFKMVTDALFAGLKRAETDFGVRAEMLCSILRDHPVGSKTDVPAGVNPLDLVLDKTTATAWATVKQCVAFNQQVEAGGKKLLAMAMDNAEVGPLPGHIFWKGVAGFPPHLFKEVYAYATLRGMKATAHAGEEGPPAYVWDALNTLNVNRIDHGVRTLEDAELVEHVVTNKIPLTVCPRSNYKLKVYPVPAQMTLLAMLDKNLLASANSDDPSYFGGYAGDQFTFIVEACAGGSGCGPTDSRRKLTSEDIRTIALNGFKSTLHLGEAEVDSYTAQVNTFMDKHATSITTYLAEY